MKKGALEEQILRASKEVVVKFIEAGRLSPSGFGETFKSIYRSIDETVKETRDLDWGDADSDPQSKS